MITVFFDEIFCSQNFFIHFVCNFHSELWFNISPPNIPSLHLSHTFVYNFCSHHFFCSQLMFTALLSSFALNLCSQLKIMHLFTIFVHNSLFTVCVHKFHCLQLIFSELYSKLWCTNYPDNSCLQLLLKILFYKLCSHFGSKIFFTTLIHNFGLRIISTIYSNNLCAQFFEILLIKCFVQNFCFLPFSWLWFKTHAHKFCSQTVFITFDYNLSSKFLFTTIFTAFTHMFS